jgi:hypothetical protein
MNYQVKRGEEEFGPYSLSDLQSYVQSGRVTLEDLTKSDGMADWVPVSEVLGTVPIPVAATAGASNHSVYSAEEEQLRRVNLPPNLPWWILLILSLFTRQLFNFIWALVQANWARKLCGSNTPLVLVAMYPAGMISGLVAVAISGGQQGIQAIGGLLIIAGFIFYVVGIFSIKSAMEGYYNSTENIGMQLSPVMTFFFGIVYFQYHVNDLARGKKRALSIA